MADYEMALVIDDSRFARMMIRKAIEEIAPGCRVFEAESADDALERLEQLTTLYDLLDLITIDHFMPGMKGFDLAKILMGRCANALILIVSSNTQDAFQEEVAQLGVGYVDKPIDREKLEIALAKYGREDE